MRSAIIILLLLFAASAFSQYKPRNVLEKEFFIGNWKLVEVRNGNIATKPSETRTLRFTKDSVFITSGTKHFSGTWAQKKSQLYITIAGTSEFNYKWVSIGQGLLCLRVGDNFSKIECFRKEN